MPRPEVDWSSLQQGAELYPPFEVYGSGVDAEVARLEDEIRQLNAASSYTMKRLVSFGLDSDPEDSYVRHAAVLEVFSRHGLLDAYYDPRDEKAMLTFANDGWKLRLHEPGNPRYFLVSFDENSRENRLLQILHYGKSN